MLEPQAEGRLCCQLLWSFWLMFEKGRHVSTLGRCDFVVLFKKRLAHALQGRRRSTGSVSQQLRRTFGVEVPGDCVAWFFAGSGVFNGLKGTASGGVPVPIFRNQSIDGTTHHGNGFGDSSRELALAGGHDVMM